MAVEAVRSGMRLEVDERRQRLEEKCWQAFRLWYTSFGRAGGEGLAQGVMEEMGREPEMVIVERCDYGGPEWEKCVAYAFGTRMGEAWARDLGKQVELAIKTSKFLGERGYRLVEEPEEGDVAVYMEGDWGEGLEHCGIYERGKVTSRFGRGYVFSHPVEAVPESWGKRVDFWRKAGRGDDE